MCCCWRLNWSKDPRNNLTWRYPLSVSAAFGLLHGLGFAAVLQELGLPQMQLAVGLVSFNIGVEVGQMIFVLLIMVLLSLINSLGFEVNRLRKLTGQGVGILAGFWFMERMGGVLQWPA